MTASEVRLGNLVYGFKTTWQIDPTDFIGDRISTYKPIPLREEWFIKFGFEKRKNYFIKDGEYRFTLTDEKVYMQVGEDALGCYLLTIQYVHQLQNLYFALMNTELTEK